MKLASPGITPQSQEGEQRCLNSELWHACAGPLVSLPTVGSRVVYFPQGHSEQVAASTNKVVDSHIPNYPNLSPQLICQLHGVTMHADLETDEVYAQMTLQPLSPEEQKDPYLPYELGASSKQPTNYFYKTLTASDTSTHGGFSVPRRAAEKVFPPLDFSQQPPAQELIAQDLHDNEWKFRHIFRGQPKRHLLTTGWSIFVSAKRLAAGDSVLFIWNENNQLFLGIRRANRPQTVMPSSMLSSDSMHIGLLAAAAHAAATNSRFTIFYNPRASPSEFVIPLAKYVKAVYHTRVSVGMRFRMLFETEESSVRRYMGTITGIGDLDPVRWPSSHWRSVKVGWDESTTGERQPRASLWEIEPITTFPMYPSPFPLRLKRPWPQGVPSLYGRRDDDMGLNSPLMWLRDGGNAGIQSLNFQGIGINPWIHQRLENSMLGLQPDMYHTMAEAALHEFRTVDAIKHEPPALMQFQQAQNVSSRPASLLPSQVVQQLQPQLQQNFLQSLQENQALRQAQSNFLQHQYQQYQSFSEQQQQHQKVQQQQQQKIQQQQEQQQKLQQQQQEQQQKLQQQQQEQQQKLQQQQQEQQQKLQQQQQKLQHQQQHQQQKQKLQHQQLQEQQNIQQEKLQEQQKQQQQPQHQQMQLPLQQEQIQQQKHLLGHQRNPRVSGLSLLTSASQSQPQLLQAISSFSQAQNFQDSSIALPTSGNFPLQSILRPYSPEDSSNLRSLQRTNPLITSSPWSTKRAAVEAPASSGAQCLLSQVEQLGDIQPNSSQYSNSLPSFPGREGLVEQEGCMDPQNHLLFGVNIDSPLLLLQNGMHNLRNVGSMTDSTAMPYSADDLLSAPGADFTLNQALTSSSGIEESEFLQSPDNEVRGNEQNGTFVKVYKSGSYGRSLDITRFNSYPELHRELGRLFGLEVQLEDPLRSGWQLVFVDQENDVLLVGDDPWHEFVNNVWCIKILSPQEVQQMGKQGVELPDLVPITRLLSSSCDEYVNRQESRNLVSGITSVGSLEGLDY